MKKWLPLLITALFALWIASSLRAPKDKPDQFAVQEFGRLPIISNGRFQPFDSLARNSLLQLRGIAGVPLEGNGPDGAWGTWESFGPHAGKLHERKWYQFSKHPKKLKPAAWLAEMLFDPKAADTRYAFVINHPDVRSEFKLGDGVEKSGLHFYRFNDLRGHLGKLQPEARRANGLDQSHRTPYDQAIVRLWNNVGLYMKLQNTIQPQNATNWPAELQAYLASVEKGIEAARAQQAGKEHDKAALDTLLTQLQTFDTMQQLEPPLVIPPSHEGHEKDDWMRSGAALMEIARGHPPHAALLSYAQIAGAYRSNDIAAFNTAVREYRASLAGSYQAQLAKAASEWRFNQYGPFYKSMVVYIAALVGALLFWVRPASWEMWRRTSAWLVMLGLVVHTSGLIYRMVLEGRPPVTNLYSSAIFIGWGACILGLVLERFWRNGVGIVVSSVIGFVTLIIAHHLSLSGDTMEMMRAVLDTNIWLATHVVVMVLGYASTFVAGFLAIIYILRGVFTSGLDQPTAKSLVKMIYGIVCFATLFSFVGTVLGGIWADQSWGRFWGWDPKENGALIIVLWNALILHARWGGMVRERGLVNMAIVGNIVTSWSWFGVNMLGIGLHSYGFMDAAFYWLMSFVLLQLALVALGSLPLRLWRSFREMSVPGGKALPA